MGSNTSAAYAVAYRFAHAFFGGAETQFPVAVMEDVGRKLMRVEEVAGENRDAFGNWEPPIANRAKWSIPDVDRLVADLGRSIGMTARVPWGSSRPFAVCITHDVDGVSEKNHARRAIRRLRRVFGPSGPHLLPLTMALGSLVRLVQRLGRPDGLGCFERWLELADTAGAPTTWFFLPGEYARAHPFDIDYAYGDPVMFAKQRMTVSQMIRRIAESGSEIGLHGSYLSSDDPEMLRNQRLLLEQASGKEVSSIRQHFLRYDASSTPGVHEAAGFRADSTLGFNLTSGFRAGTSYPFQPWDKTKNRLSSVVEVPMILMDGHLRSMNLSGPEARAHCASLIDTVERTGGCLTLNWHPNHIHDALYWDAIVWVIGECARRGAWFATVGEVAQLWRESSRTP